MASPLASCWGRLRCLGQQLPHGHAGRLFYRCRLNKQWTVNWEPQFRHVRNPTLATTVLDLRLCDRKRNCFLALADASDRVNHSPTHLNLREATERIENSR